MIVTSAQFREAHKLLGWSQERVAAEILMSRQEITRFEKRTVSLSAAQRSALRAALETAGVEFIAENGGPGVRLREPR
jgi:transcriptional regulator with XRE-family HTH domain